VIGARSSLMRRAGVALAIAGASAALSAQRPAPILRASVEQVVVDVVVTDADGAPVFGLTAADFEVAERDRPQAIATFSEVTLPRGSRTPDGPPAMIPAGEVRSNRLAGTNGVYLLLLDELHVSVARTPIVRREARAFVRRYVQPGDVVAVLQTRGSGRGLDFTEDMALVDAAIEGFVGQKDPSPTVQGIEGRVPQRLDPHDGKRALPGRPVTTPVQMRTASDALRTIVNAAGLLEAAPGQRKAMLYFSEGIAIPPETTAGQELMTLLDRTWTAAARANLTIYPIDPRGLSPMGEELLSLARAPTAEQRLALDRERNAAADILRGLAEGTGGVAAVETNNLGRTLDRVASDSRHYYLLGYVPTESRRDGRYRALSVRVKRPGLRISARKGYTAPSDTPPPRTAPTPIADARLSPELRALLERPLPEGGLTFAAAPVVLPGVDRNVRIVIEVAPRALPADTSAGSHENTLELAILAVDRSGRTLPTRKGRATISAEDAAAVAGGGLRVVEEMTLPAGRYQLRIALREQRAGASGVVICDLEVPDPQAPGLAMSSVILGAASGARVPSLNADDRLAAGLGGATPTTARTFAPGDVVHAFVELAAGRTSGDSIAVTATIHDAQGRVVLTRDGTAIATPSQPARQTLDLPIEDTPGRYVLRFEGRAGGEKPIARDVWFEIGAPSR
jgi:VWFA-related protein